MGGGDSSLTGLKNLFSPLCDHFGAGRSIFCDMKTYMSLLTRVPKDKQKEESKADDGKSKYFEATLGHFGVLIVKLHPLLDDAADAGLRVVDELEAGDVGPAFPEVRQVDVQEALGQDGQAEERTVRQTEEK